MRGSPGRESLLVFLPSLDGGRSLPEPGPSGSAGESWRLRIEWETHLDDTSGQAPVALTNVEIPSKGRVLKSQDEATSTRDQRGAGHLPGGFQKRVNLGSEGIGNELQGVDPVIHGPEHHSVPR